MNPIKAHSHWVPQAVAHFAITVIVSFATPLHAEDELSVQEILSRSQKAMQPPIRYTLHTSGVSITVTEKAMPNGSNAVRTEANHPFKIVSIHREGSSVEIYPDQATILDTTYQLESLNRMRNTAASASVTLGNIDPGLTTIRGSVVRNSRDCFEIESIVSPQIQKLVSDNMPAQLRQMAPARTLYLIDKESYEVIEIETRSASGASVSKSVFSDYDHNPDVPDELFLPPDGMEIKRPQSDQEKISMLSKLFMPEMTGSELDVDELLRRKKSEFREQTQRLREQAIQDEEEYWANRPAELNRQKSRIDSHNERPMSWTLIIGINLLLVIVLIAAVLINRRR